MFTSGLKALYVTWHITLTWKKISCACLVLTESTVSTTANISLSIAVVGT